MGKTDEEIHYLRWFYQNADFGPAHGDVMYELNKRYMEETGFLVPSDYCETCEEEE